MSYESSFFLFHSHSVSIGSVFGLPFAHQRLSNRRLPYFFIIQGSLEYISFRNFSMEVTFSVSFFSPVLATLLLQRLFCKKIFVLKYFRRTLTLRKFFNMKIFPTKYENFPIYGIHLLGHPDIWVGKTNICCRPNNN